MDDAVKSVYTDSMKLIDLTPDAEFVIADKLGDGYARDELRLTFYNKVRNLDEKRVEVELFGCVQIVLETLDEEESVPLKPEQIELLKSGKLVLYPRYSNLDDHRCRPAPMSGAYIICDMESAASARLFYRDLRQRVEAAVNAVEMFRGIL